MPAGRRCTNPNPNLNRIYLFELKSTLLRSVIYLFIEFQKIILQLFFSYSVHKQTTVYTVYECQVNFGFLPAKYQILIRTAKFLQKFIASENSLCTLFISDARQQLRGIFMQCGRNIQTAFQLRNAIYRQFLTVNACCIAFVYCFLIVSVLAYHS